MAGSCQSRPGRARYSLAEMRAMLDCMENADPEGGRAAAHKHVRAAAAAARESFEKLAHKITLGCGSFGAHTRPHKLGDAPERYHRANEIAQHRSLA